MGISVLISFHVRYSRWEWLSKSYTSLLSMPRAQAQVFYRFVSYIVVLHDAPLLLLSERSPSMKETFHLYVAFLSAIHRLCRKPRIELTRKRFWRFHYRFAQNTITSLTVCFSYFDVGDNNGEITWECYSSRYPILFLAPSSSQRKVEVNMLGLWFMAICLDWVHCDKACSPHSSLLWYKPLAYTQLADALLLPFCISRRARISPVPLGDGALMMEAWPEYHVSLQQVVHSTRATRAADLQAFVDCNKILWCGSFTPTQERWYKACKWSVSNMLYDDCVPRMTENGRFIAHSPSSE